MQSMKDDEIRQAVRKNYGEIAKSGAESCGCSPSASSSDGNKPSAADVSARIGYSADEVASVPEGANMGLGCGNPHAIASLQPGETVLDLGSGGGIDCFLAAKAVGREGRVIGVDMTPEMISKSREYTEKSKVSNVEFRLGEIEHIPAADNSVDVIMSNCVINLSPDKPSVYKEAFRVLKKGGRLAITDVVATAPMPAHIKESIELHAGCVAGAAQIDELKMMLEDAGFTNIRINPKEGSKEAIREWFPESKIEDYVVSATIEAVKA
ncbi:MAG: arsenite methyltransferase [Planctomycetota bacterium]|jgi:SAM-dependent methyltransferase